MKLFLLILPALVLAAPEGPKTGPPGTKLVYDLLQNQYGGQLGAFNTVYWQPGHVNEEQQWYVPENAHQDASGQITIKAERRSDGQVYSARLESYGLWTTASSPATKNRGYVEVKALIPAKVGGGNLKGPTKKLGTNRTSFFKVIIFLIFQVLGQQFGCWVQAMEQVGQPEERLTLWKLPMVIPM